MVLPLGNQGALQMKGEERLQELARLEDSRKTWTNESIKQDSYGLTETKGETRGLARGLLQDL